MNLDDQQRMEATDLAVDAKVLKQCEYHGEIYDPGVVDLQPAYMLVNLKFTHGKIYSFRDRREMTAAIKASSPRGSNGLLQCEKQREEYP